MKHSRGQANMKTTEFQNSFIFYIKINPKADFLISTCLAVLGSNNTAKRRAADGLPLPFENSVAKQGCVVAPV